MAGTPKREDHAMHTLFSRANVLLVNFVLAGAFLAILTTCTGMWLALL